MDRQKETMTPEEMLDQLAEFEAQKDVLNFSRDEQVKKITEAKREEISKYLTPEIQAKIDEIEQDYKLRISDLWLEYEDKSGAVDTNIAKLADKIKTEVVKRKQTAFGKYLKCVFNKGKNSYSDKPKAGYEKTEIYCRVGEPYGAISKV